MDSTDGEIEAYRSRRSRIGITGEVGVVVFAWTKPRGRSAYDTDPKSALSRFLPVGSHEVPLIELGFNTEVPLIELGFNTDVPLIESGFTTEVPLIESGFSTEVPLIESASTRTCR